MLSFLKLPTYLIVVMLISCENARHLTYHKQLTPNGCSKTITEVPCVTCIISQKWEWSCLRISPRVWLGHRHKSEGQTFFLFHRHNLRPTFIVVYVFAWMKPFSTAYIGINWLKSVHIGLLDEHLHTEKNLINGSLNDYCKAMFRNSLQIVLTHIAYFKGEIRCACG